MNFSLLVLEHKYITEYDDMYEQEQAYHQREDSRQPSQSRDLRSEGYIFIF